MTNFCRLYHEGLSVVYNIRESRVENLNQKKHTYHEMHEKEIFAHSQCLRGCFNNFSQRHREHRERINLTEQGLKRIINGFLSVFSVFSVPL